MNQGTLVIDEELEEFVELKPVRRGWKRFFFRTILVLVILLVGLFMFRRQLGLQGEKKLTEVVQGIDISEQNWKLQEIEAGRIAREPVEEQNAAKLVLEVAGQIPETWNIWRKSSSIWEPSHDNHLPPLERIKEHFVHQDSTREVRNRASKLVEQHLGRYPLVWPDNPVALSLPHLDSAGRVVSLLEYDARLAAIDRDPSRGIRDAHAALNVARSIGDEPTLVSQNFRLMYRSRAVITAMGALAIGIPTTGLAELQAAILSEADEPAFIYGLRGERAAYHRMFEGLQSGRLKIESLYPTTGDGGTPLAIPAVFQAYKPLLAADHAECIRLYSCCIEAARLPWHQQRVAIRKITVEKENLAKNIYPLTHLAFPAVDNLVEKCLRSRAQLAIAAAAIACERFRQQNGRWPRELAEIPKEILPAIPRSPFDERLPHYQILPDRIALHFYSCQIDNLNDQTVVFRDPRAGPIEFRNPEIPGFGIAVCVWNPAQRGLAFQEVVADKNKP